MIKRMLRPGMAWLVGRLDHIAAGVDQINRDGSKTSDPARDQVLLSLRDSVSLVGSSVSRLEAAVSEAWLAGEPVWRYRDALAVAALADVEPGSTVVVVGESSAVDVVAVVRAMGLRPVVVDVSAVEAITSLAARASAVVIVGGEELVAALDRTDRVVAPVPARTIVGLAVADRDPVEALGLVADTLGWPEEHRDRLRDALVVHPMVGSHPSGATTVAFADVTG